MVMATQKKTMKYIMKVSLNICSKNHWRLRVNYWWATCFLCVYWLFRLDTDRTRDLYIGAFYILALILIKILSFFNDE